MQVADWRSDDRLVTRIILYERISGYLFGLIHLFIINRALSLIFLNFTRILPRSLTACSITLAPFQNIDVLLLIAKNSLSSLIRDRYS